MSTTRPPLLAGPPGNAPARVAFDEGVAFEVDISPFAGGWSADGVATFESLFTASPAYLRTTTAGAALLVKQIHLAERNVGDAPSAQLLNLDGLRVRYFRASAGDLLQVRLLSQVRDGASATTTIADFDEATELTTTGAWTVYTGSFDVAFDPEATYWLAVELEYNSGVNDCRIGDVILSTTKYGIA